MVAATKKRQGLALASAADPRAQSMVCGTMLPTLVLRGALEMLWRGVAIPPFHSIFISFLSFHFLPLLSTSFHAPVPVPVAVFSFSFSFPFCSCPFRFVPALSFFCALFPVLFSFFPCSCPVPSFPFAFPLSFLAGQSWRNLDVFQSRLQPVSLPPFSQPPYQPEAGLIGMYINSCI